MTEETMTMETPAAKSKSPGKPRRARADGPSSQAGWSGSLMQLKQQIVDLRKELSTARDTISDLRGLIAARDQAAIDLHLLLAAKDRQLDKFIPF